MTIAMRKMTSTEFLDWALKQPEGKRYELIHGVPVAMAPERVGHAIAKSDVYAALRNAVRSHELDCVVVGDGVTVVIDEDTSYEPDAAMQCSRTVDLESTTLDAPLLVVEVLSPSSAERDSTSKLRDYFRLPSLRHYLIVDPLERLVVHYARGEDGALAARTVSVGEALSLDPPGIAVPVEAFFAGLPETPR